MIWVAVALLIALAVVMVVGEPAEHHDAEDLAAAGWNSTTIATASWASAVVIALLVFAAVAVTTGAPAAPALGLAIGAWAPVWVPARIRGLVFRAHSLSQSSALHSWLRRVRLYAAVGLPMREAAVEAAHQTTDRAFGPVASAIALALEAGRDPLTAAAQRVRGSAAETLLGTVDTVERTGAAATDLIDHVMDRAIAMYAADGAERTDRIGRATETLGTIVVAFGVLLLILGISVSINSGAPAP